MKKLIYLSVIALVVVSCKKEPKNYVTFSGKITNPNSDSLVISNPKIGYKKTIMVDEKGVFKDTLKVKDNYFSVYDGKEYTSVYLKTGKDLQMTLNTAQFDETVKFEGEGSEESNFLAAFALEREQLFSDKQLFSLPKEAFNKKIGDFVEVLNKRFANGKLDSKFIASQKQNLEGLKQMLTNKYAENVFIANNLAKGTVSPKFVDYENHKGGTTSLDDLKGKYVYIDLWATWCQPCKTEIPFMKKMEEKYHGKNIEFVSISVDDKRDYDTWKKMVEELKMGGVQLYAKGDRTFAESYKVSGIPRFILLDPNGVIIDANAPRPSEAKLVELIDSLKI